MGDSLGDRIKGYESISNIRLLPKTPVILRVDGKAFHTFAKDAKRPFDDELISSMVMAGTLTAKEMQGFILGYHQSDEFTFYINNCEKLETQAWFNNELPKLISITASLFTMNFNKLYKYNWAVFDCRAFSVPPEDVANVFIWRQRDWERNSLQMFARTFFSHKELQNKSSSDIHEMLHNIGQNWADLNPVYKNGTFICKDGNKINEKLDYESLQKILYKTQIL